MPERYEDVLRRLERIETQQDEMLVQLATISGLQARASEAQAAIVAEVGGVPAQEGRGQRANLRDRVHVIESEQFAAKLLQEAQAQRRASARMEWTWRQKWLLFVFAAAAAAEGLLRLLGVGG